MRYPAVSGQFYSNSSKSLERQIDSFLDTARKETKISSDIGISPHAGYEYSGKIAALTFASLEKNLKKKNTTVIIAGPNHTGIGGLVAVSFEDWKTPIGVSSTDLRLAGAIIQNCTIISKDELAHFREHSIEVLLPFLQRINPQAKIVAVCIGLQEQRVAAQVGRAIFEACAKEEFKDRNIVLLSSSDFSHYVSGEMARKMDKMALEFIKQLNSYEFEREIVENELTICGHGPIVVAIEYAKLAGKKQGKVLKYSNSGLETGGNEAQIVAYAGIVFV